MNFAPTFTQNSTESTVDIAASGQSVYIYGIIITNKTSAAQQTTTFSTTDSAADTIFEIESGARQTIVINIPFLADRGFSFVNTAGTPPEDIEVTVFHSNIGA